jgi:glyoxylase-like metal-dependent hydrolase (beta-lactamase superfamily II)
MGVFLTGSRRRRRTVVTAMMSVVVALVGFTGWLWCSARIDASFSRSRVSRLVRASVRVAPGLYMLGDLAPSAVYVIESSKGLILVDSGLDEDAGPVKAEMAKLGLDWRRVRAILLTHAHGDHAGGAEALRLATGAKIYAGAGDVAVLAEGGPREAVFSTFYMPDHEPHPTTVDVVLKGDETIALGDVRVRAIAAKGHTPGSMCYVLEREDFRALFAGDVIMMLRGDAQPRTELGKPLGTYSAYLSSRYRGNAKDYLDTLRRLRQMPVPDLVLPGHPRADVSPESPCLSQERWELLLDRGIADLETVLSRYAVDGADFLDGVPKTLLPDLYYLGNFRGSAIYAFFASSKCFMVDAPGGPGLVEFVRSGLRRLGRERSDPAAVLLTSCGRSATAGLKELVEKCHIEVVASYDGVGRLRESLPPGTKIIPAEELPAKGWFPVVPFPLRGLGFAPAAYELGWSGKTVLFTGKIPQFVTQETGQRLIGELTSTSGDIRGYSASIDELRPRKPDLWLPAIPVNDQNANLYDVDWKRVIEDNITLINIILSSSGRR